MNSTSNPFIEAYQQGGFATPDHAIAFDQIKAGHFLPALDFALGQARENLEKIKSDKAPARFANTLLALETCSELFDQVAGVFHNLFVAEGVPEIQALAQEVAVRTANFSSEILLDAKLFQRIEEAFTNAKSEKLNGEEKRLLEKTHRHFVRNGARLSEEDKSRLRDIDQQLAQLAPVFMENVLKATNAFELWIDRREDLAGLPEGVIEAAAHEAKEKGRGGAADGAASGGGASDKAASGKGRWLFTLQEPSLRPFLMYSTIRPLREKMWRAYGSRAFHDEFDNQENIKKMVSLRHQRARLLGFPSHAEFVLEERMADSPAKVKAFLEKLLIPSRQAAEREINELRQFAQDTDGLKDMMPWDFSFYVEKLKEKKFHFTSESLRPYFPLEKVIAGVFEHARKLYGLVFKKRSDIPVYHPEVEAFEVKNEKTGEYVGLFFADFFPRPTKKGGAWMTTYREQGLFQGEIRRPQVSIVCNFTKPTPQKPSLLSFEEVTTLFHEFGHALHGLLASTTFRSLSGTNVYTDFVELPSQLMENWAREKEGLALFARHHQTGEMIPADLYDRMKQSEKFLAGYFSLRQLSFALLDMGWHSAAPAGDLDVAQFERQLTERTRVLPVVPGVNTSCSFSHIFAGMYSAGYYSYKWAEVLDADTFEAFKEAGLFNSEIANRFRATILSRGGTAHPMELYKQFRGREPDPNALLRRYGLQA
ncbi:MAG: peptidase M3 [Bdellovibrio sp.]|nr:MAG: peptidase M3 [Bdellovibrio sp.]